MKERKKERKEERSVLSCEVVELLVFFIFVYSIFVF